AQEPTTISGRVTTGAGAPVVSAAVVIQELNIGAFTNADGRYAISVPAARAQGQTVTLAASSFGHKAHSERVVLRPGVLVQDFSLAPDPLLLEQIVVTGAGTQTVRAKLGNVINSVRSEEIVKSSEVNVVQALAGKAPNVEVYQGSGEPGASSFVRIRGVKTSQGSAQPLIVVDGVPLDNSTNSTGSFLASTVAPNRASDLNPADIESVEILKGAAAAAIYGSRAGQGVILITTKSGKPGPTRYTFRSMVTTDKVNLGVPLQTRFGQGSGGKAATCSGLGCRPSAGSYGPELAPGTPTYDHFWEMFQSGNTVDNTLSVSGGNDRTTFYLSAERMDQNGTIIGPNNWYDRTTARLKASHRLMDNLTVGGNISYVDARGSFIQKGSNISGLLLGALRTPPEFNNALYKDSVTGLHRSYRYPRPTTLATSRGYDNPFFLVNEGRNTGQVGRVFGNVDINYRALDWLSVKYTLGTDYSSDERLEAFPPSSSNRSTGQMNRANFVTNQIDSNLLFTLNHTFSNKLAGTLALGHNINSRSYRQNYVTGYDFIAPDVFTLNNDISWEPNEFESLVHTESFFGQATVDLYNQLFLTGAVRNDGSSTFGASQRRHWFPKASIAWNFTETLGDLGGNLSFGKVRLAYGQTGSQPGAYQTITAFSTGNFGDGGWGPYLSPTWQTLNKGGLATSTLKGQDKLRPERTREYEAGVDIGLFSERMALGLTYYDDLSKDVIFSTPLPPSTGFTRQVQNAATISNKGWELTLDFRPIVRRDFEWDIGFQWAKNRNLVEDLVGAEFVLVGGAFSGSPGAVVKGHQAGVLRGGDFARCGRALVIDGVDIDAQCGGAAGALYIAEDGFPILDPEQRVIMDPFPDWTGAVRTAVRIGKLSLSGLVDFKKGGQMWNGTRGALYNFGTHKDTEIRGEQRAFGSDDFHPGAVAGPGAGKQVTIDEDWFTGLGNGFGPVATQFIEDAGFVKLRELSAAYSFTQDFVRSFGVNSLDVRLGARNLHTWTDYTGIDPETNLSGAEANLRGIDYFNNPQTRSYVLSVTVNR
ncbi:MAG: SusC/RagA family TonB-linked outer membrane protein, partial [Gemmatimonadota bacterium]